MNKLVKNNKPLEDLSDLVLWENLASISKNKEIVKKFSQIPEDTYRFALKKSNHKFLVKSALKSLRKTDPKATKEQAKSLADMLHIIAKMFIFEIEAARKERKQLKK